MKIFVTNKKNVIFYLVLFLCAMGLLAMSPKASISVFNEEKVDRLLPVYRVDRGEEKVCALTFDAAWDDADTDKLIEILNKEEVKATFFMVGDWVRKYPESVKKFADSGHEIMNHSNTHPHIDKLSFEKVKEEISACDASIEALTGVRPTLFRGPYGEYNNTVIEAAAELGHTVLQWDVDSLDWKDLDAESMTARVLKRVKPGSILLFHNGAKHTPEALPEIIQKLKADGYRFVKASELLLPEPTMIDHTGTQKSAGSENNAPKEEAETSE